MKLKDQIKWFNENTQHAAEALPSGEVKYSSYKVDGEYKMIVNLSRFDFTTMVYRMKNQTPTFDKVSIPENWLNA